MKELLILRHGKSDWSSPGTSDHERPLKRRGRLAAKRVGLFLRRAELVPDLVLSSSAERARTTAELALQAGGWDCPLQVERGLYETSATSVLELLREQRTDAQRILVAGHEPTSSAVVAKLTGGLPPLFRTCTLACIQLAIPAWREIEPGTGVLELLVSPVHLEALVEDV